jgi:hypothetical protein
MTLIAAFQFQNYPILLGDALLVEPSEPPFEHAPIPTRKDFSRLKFARNDRRVAGLGNKLAVIHSKSLAVAWAGRQDHAVMVLQYLYGHLLEKYSIKDIRIVLSEVSELIGKPDVILLGCFVRNGSGFCLFRWQGKINEFSIGSAFSEGTGKNVFNEHLQKRLDNPEKSPHSLLFPVELIGRLYSYEIFSGDNLPYLFGGGFDVIYYHAGAFRRPESMIHLFLGADITSIIDDRIQYDLVGLPLLIWQEFSDEWHIERIELNGGLNVAFEETVTSEITATYKDAIPLTVFESKEEDVPLKDDDDPARFVSVTMHFFIGDSEVYASTHVFWIPHSAISISRTDKLIKLHLSSKFRGLVEKARFKAFQTEEVRHLIAQAIAQPQGG